MHCALFQLVNCTHTYAVVFQRRAKLFRFDSPEGAWKERGTGDVRLLKHKVTNKVRLVMRRDKTLKVCANHLSTYLPCLLINFIEMSYPVSSEMRLQPNIGSDRSWVWKVHADYADGAPQPETLAIRFANAESMSNLSLASLHILMSTSRRQQLQRCF